MSEFFSEQDLLCLRVLAAHSGTPSQLGRFANAFCRYHCTFGIDRDVASGMLLVMLPQVLTDPRYLELSKTFPLDDEELFCELERLILEKAALTFNLTYATVYDEYAPKEGRDPRLGSAEFADYPPFVLPMFPFFGAGLAPYFYNLRAEALRYLEEYENQYPEHLVLASFVRQCLEGQSTKA